jgi:hypothetical protein
VSGELQFVNDACSSAIPTAGPLKSIGTALLPVPNVEGHLIEGVIQALRALW